MVVVRVDVCGYVARDTTLYMEKESHCGASRHINTHLFENE